MLWFFWNSFCTVCIPPPLSISPVPWAPWPSPIGTWFVVFRDVLCCRLLSSLPVWMGHLYCLWVQGVVWCQGLLGAQGSCPACATRPLIPSDCVHMTFSEMWGSCWLSCFPGAGTRAAFFFADNWLPLRLTCFLWRSFNLPQGYLESLSASQPLHSISASAQAVSIASLFLCPGWFVRPQTRSVCLSSGKSALILWHSWDECFSSFYSCPYFLSHPSIQDLFSPRLSFSFRYCLHCELSCIARLGFFLPRVLCHLGVWGAVCWSLTLHVLLLPRYIICASDKRSTFPLKTPIDSLVFYSFLKQWFIWFFFFLYSYPFILLWF